MSDAPLFPRIPFCWHFDLSQQSQLADTGTEEGVIYVGNSGEWGCFIEEVRVASYVRPVLSLFFQEIGDSSPRLLLTVAPEDPDPLDFYGFSSLRRLPTSHRPLKSLIRIPPHLSIYIRADNRSGTMLLRWEDTESGGNIPLLWEDTELVGFSPRTWEQSTPEFIFVKGCIGGRGG